VTLEKTCTIGGDLEVNRLGFGAMRVLGRDRWWGEPDDREYSLRLIRRAVELGCNLIDTAYSYGAGLSEALIAEALHPYPDGVVIATKGGMHRVRETTFRDARPETLRRECDESLRRLRLERIDLYQLHRVDPNVSLEESVGTLAALRDEGKIRHVGLSNVDVSQVERARQIVPIASVQNRYSIVDREHEPVLEACEQAGIAFLPYSPLEGGRALPDGMTRRNALRWLLERSPVVCPIPGTSSIEHLEANVAAAA
jgi:aryl-alcohol dehydrogenase-like predicted oxidoreductase